MVKKKKVVKRKVVKRKVTKKKQEGYYSDERILNDSLKVIKDKRLLFLEDIFPHTIFVKSTFYKRNFHKSDIIKEALYSNRVMYKQNLRVKWYNSDKPVTQIALYKLIGTDEERDILNGANDQGFNKDLNLNITFEDE